jgi:Na+/H+ antiporter NhaD/arsenite permease-like protein
LTITGANKNLSLNHNSAMTDNAILVAGGVILLLVFSLLSRINGLKKSLDQSEAERQNEQERYRRDLEEKEQQLKRAKSITFRMKLMVSVLMSGAAKQLFDEPMLGIGVLVATLAVMLGADADV